MNEWTPVVYRGDGAWIGIMPDGRIGVGVEQEGRAPLEGSGFMPMWPFLARDLAACLDEFARNWERFEGGGVATPEKLIELTAGTAWNSGRSYWMQMSVPWIVKMAERPEFDQKVVHELLREMKNSDVLTPELLEQVRRAGS